MRCSAAAVSTDRGWSWLLTLTSRPGSSPSPVAGLELTASAWFQGRWRRPGSSVRASRPRRREHTMHRGAKKAIVATAVVAGLAVAGVGVAVAGGAGGRDSDTPITGPDRQRASDAALRHMGGGRVTGTE